MAFRQMAGGDVDHSDQVNWSSLYSFSKKSVYLGSQQENHGKVVEEDQQNNQADRACITVQEVRYIDRKEHEVYLKRCCRHNRSQPAIAKTDMLVGNNHINGLEQQESCKQTSEYTS